MKFQLHRNPLFCTLAKGRGTLSLFGSGDPKYCPCTITEEDARLRLGVYGAQT